MTMDRIEKEMKQAKKMANELLYKLTQEYLTSSLCLKNINENEKERASMQKQGKQESNTKNC